MDFQNISPWLLVSGFVFGVFGFYIFRQGKSDANAKRAILGILVMAYGYFVTNPWLNWLVGIALVFLNFRWTWFDE